MARPNVFGLIFKIDASDQKKFKQIGKEVNALSKDINKNLGGSFINLKTLATGFIATMAGSKLASEINEFAATGDRIAKTAATIGLATDSLQELEYVAGQQGATTEGLNSAFQTLNTNLGKLQVGQGKLGKFLQKSNPQLLQQLKTTKNSEQAFLLLQDAISKETDTSRRAALATMAFGGASQEMIKFSKGGIQTINELREAKRRFGIISEDAAKASEAFGDAQDDLKQATQGVIAAGLGPLLPKLTKVIKAMTEWVANNKEFIGQKMDQVFSAIETSVSILVKLWESGLLPALISGIALYKTLSATIEAGKAAWATYTTLMTLANGSTLLMLKSWLAVNAAFLASPIGLIVLGLAALVAVSILVYKNWDYLVQKGKDLWSWMKKLWESSQLLRVAFYIMGGAAALALSPIIIAVASISAAIYGLYKAWQSIKGYLPNWLGGDKSPDAPPNAPSIPGMAGGNMSGPQSSNAGVIQSNQTITNRSTLDVNFNNVPTGTTTKQTGSAPGINLNTGVGMSRG